MDADVLNLKTLFGSEVSYRIPQFQRPYAWKREDQWEPLWEDVRKVAGNVLRSEASVKIPPHFMGAIVLQQQPSGAGEVSKRIVVDGQQRLTTLQLLIQATREAFLTLNESDGATRLAELTRNGDAHLAGDLDNQTKIRQSNLNDQKAFQEVIRNIGQDGPALHTISQAFQYFKERVTAWLDQEPAQRVSRANALELAITEYLQIAAVNLDEEEKPHFIFGVLNARAEPLRQCDHIKNTVMYEADVIDDAQKARGLWGMFDNDWWREGTNEGRVTDRIHLDRFLNYWVVSKRRRDVPSNRVSAAFTALVEQNKQEGHSIDEVAAEVRKAGRIYQDIEDARLPGIEVFLKRMKDMELGVVMPPLLWLYTHDVPEERRKRGVYALESYLVRRMLCRMQSQGLNRLFIEILERLEKGGDGKADDTILDFLNEQDSENRIWPHDQLLYQHLIDSPLQCTNRRQKMVLEAIEMALRTDWSDGGELPDKLTVEHIMPQGWGERNWPLAENAIDRQEATDDRNRAVKEIGNLTLVSVKLNAGLSNDPWSKKRETLDKHTTLRLNRELLQSAPSDWNEELIHERSKRLYDEIVKIWPYADKL